MISGQAASDFELVAHRGDAARFPENTIAAFESARRLGLHHVELDVQITADGIPLVLHDETLRRTHGLGAAVTRRTRAELAELGVLARGSRPPPVPTLGEFATWLATRTDVFAFVELKRESLRVHGRERAVAASGSILAPLRRRVAIISYDVRALALAARAGFAIGYVLPGMRARIRARAERLAPQYLFAEWRHLLRARRPWPGAWSWAAFEVEDARTARALAALGVRFVETMNPEAMTAFLAGSTTHER